ncbi:hypothetical protein [Streptomyces griseoaurantiacus]|uniref:hypothetical protein n=1 Tax=Streptomyces griseoaurantiacus TaxID=68213 RepID=UPI003699215C
MPQMTADVQLVTLGGTIRLTARRSDGCTVEISLTEGARRGSALRAVTDARGRLVSASARSWPLSGVEPQLAGQAREAIRLAEGSPR